MAGRLSLLPGCATGAEHGSKTPAMLSRYRGVHHVLSGLDFLSCAEPCWLQDLKAAGSHIAEDLVTCSMHSDGTSKRSDAVALTRWHARSPQPRRPGSARQCLAPGALSDVPLLLQSVGLTASLHSRAVRA